MLFLLIYTLIRSFFNIRSVIDRDYENEEYVLILKLNVLTVDIGIKWSGISIFNAKHIYPFIHVLGI